MYRAKLANLHNKISMKKLSIRYSVLVEATTITEKYLQDYVLKISEIRHKKHFR